MSQTSGVPLGNASLAQHIWCQTARNYQKSMPMHVKSQRNQTERTPMATAVTV